MRTQRRCGRRSHAIREPQGRAWAGERADRPVLRVLRDGLQQGAGLLQSDATRRARKRRPLVVQPPYLSGLVVDGLGWACTIVALRQLPVFAVRAILGGAIAHTALAVRVGAARRRRCPHRNATHPPGPGGVRRPSHLTHAQARSPLLRSACPREPTTSGAPPASTGHRRPQHTRTNSPPSNGRPPNSPRQARPTRKSAGGSSSPPSRSATTSTNSFPSWASPPELHSAMLCQTTSRCQIETCEVVSAVKGRAVPADPPGDRFKPGHGDQQVR